MCRTCDRRRTVCTVYSVPLPLRWPAGSFFFNYPLLSRSHQVGTYAGCTGAWLMAGIPGQLACNVATVSLVADSIILPTSVYECSFTTNTLPCVSPPWLLHHQEHHLSISVRISVRISVKTSGTLSHSQCEQLTSRESVSSPVTDSPSVGPCQCSLAASPPVTCHFSQHKTNPVKIAPDDLSHKGTLGFARLV